MYCSVGRLGTFGIAFLALLSACSMEYEAAPPTALNTEAVGRIVRPHEAFTPEGDGFALLAMKSATPRKLRTCRAFRNALSNSVGWGSADDQAEQTVDGYLYRRPIYWPIVDAEPQSWSCSKLVSSYDFARARRFAHGLTSPGPFIIFYKPSTGTNQRMGVADFSQVPEDEFDAFFDAFLDIFVQDPNLWSPEYYQKASFRQRVTTALNETAFARSVENLGLSWIPVPTEAG